MLDIYEVIAEIVEVPYGNTISGNFSDENKQKLSREDWSVYELIKNICALVIKYHNNIADFQPGYRWEEKRSFSVLDMKDEDYSILGALELDRFPTVLSYRISELLWSTQKDYKMALQAYQYAEKLYDELRSLNRQSNGVVYLKRAIILAAQLGKKEEYHRLCNKCLEFAEMTNSQQDCYITIAFLRILIEQKYDDKDGRIQARLDRLIEENKDIDKISKAYELKIQFLQKNQDALMSVKKNYANVLIAQTDNIDVHNVMDLFTSEKNLKRAIQLMQEIGEKKAVEDIKHKLLAVQGEIPKNMAYINVKQDATNEVQLIKRLFDGLSVQEYVIRLAQCVKFYSREELKSNVLNSKSDFLGNRLFGMGYKDSKGQTIMELPPLSLENPEEDEEVLELYMFSEAKLQEELLGNNFLRWIIQILNREYSYTEDDLRFLVENNPIIPDGRERIILKAVYEGLKGDIYLALHILAPQLENIFRNIAENVGAMVIALKDDGTSQTKVLSSIFELPELLECYDNDILFLFRGLLNEKAGSNIRNEIAHGIMGAVAGNSGSAIFLLCATIKLLSYTSVQSLEIYQHLAEIDKQGEKL